MPHLPPEATQLLAAQDNVIATWQVVRPSRQQMYRAHKSGLWRQLTKTTYLAAPGDPSQEQRYWAASLHAGPSGLISGQAALVCHGWTGDHEGPTDLLVPARLNPRRTPSWLRVHRARIMPRRVRTGVPRAAAAAAVVDAAGWARTDREAMFIVVSALQQKISTAVRVKRILEKRPTAPRRAIIAATVAEFLGGATSVGEIDFGRLCRLHGIREPDRQVERSTDGRRVLDVYFDAEKVVVEIEGVHHLEPESWLEDTTRQNELILDGDRTFLRVATWTLKHEPETFLSQLKRALATGPEG